MNKIILFWSVVTCLFNSLANAQSPNYLAANSKWRINSVGLSSVAPCWTQGNYVVEIAGDTVISGLEYKKLIYHGIQLEMMINPVPGQAICSPPVTFSLPYAFLRQDGWKLYKYELNYQIDTLLYDFELEVGDTLPMTCNNLSNSITVDSISFLQFGNESRKVFHLSENSDQIHFLIEGIGHEKGLIGPMQLFEFFESVLICFQKDDVTYYSNPMEFCGMNVGLENLNSTLHFSIFPNPATDFISIQGDLGTQEPISISILDATGRIVLTDAVLKSQENLLLDISGFQVGFYTLAISAGDKKQVSYFIKN